MRNDPYLFYVCGMVSFLESRADTYVENLEPFFQCDIETLDWLKSVWLPEEAGHGNMMRRFVQKNWPELDWEKAYEEFSNAYIPRCVTEKLRTSISLEALARCITETETAMIYRCIADYTVDEELKALLRQMGKDEVRHFSIFKKIHKRYEANEKNSLVAKLRLLIDRTKLVRDEDLAMAFAPLNNHWQGERIFKPWGYEEFLTKTSMVISYHFPYEEAKRMLFNPFEAKGRFNKAVFDLLSVILKRKFTKFSMGFPR